MTTFNGINEFITFAGVRSHNHADFSILTFTTRLFSVFVVSILLLKECFAVRN